MKSCPLKMDFSLGGLELTFAYPYYFRFIEVDNVQQSTGQ